MRQLSALECVSLRGSLTNLCSLPLTLIMDHICSWLSYHGPYRLMPLLALHIPLSV